MLGQWDGVLGEFGLENWVLGLGDSRLGLGDLNLELGDGGLDTGNVGWGTGEQRIRGLGTGAWGLGPGTG